MNFDHRIFRLQFRSSEKRLKGTSLLNNHMQPCCVTKLAGNSETEIFQAAGQKQPSMQ